MPVPEHMRHTERLMVRLNPKVVEAIDKLRGDMPLAEWLTKVVGDLTRNPASAPKRTGQLL